MVWQTRTTSAPVRRRMRTLNSPILACHRSIRHQTRPTTPADRGSGRVAVSVTTLLVGDDGCSGGDELGRGAVDGVGHARGERRGDELDELSARKDGAGPGGEPLASGGTDEADDPERQRLDRTTRGAASPLLVAHRLRELDRDAVGDAGRRVAGSGGQAVRAVHHEQVDVGVAVDEADVRVSQAAYEVGDLSALAQGLEAWPDLGEDVRGDPVGHCQVQPVAVTEVAVQDRLARARTQRDLVDGHGGAVRTDRPQGGVDERGATLDAMLLPSGVASVSVLHADEGTAYLSYLLRSVSGFIAHTSTPKETND